MMNTFWDAVIAHEAPASLCWEWAVACDEVPFDGEHFMRVGIRPTALPVICLDDDALRFDPFELLRSARYGGCFGTLNCSCGYAEDVGLGSDIMVSHPDPQHIVWELERAPSRNIIEPEFQGDEGFVRLVFERCNYETEVRRMFETLQGWLNNPPRVSDLCDYDVEGSVPWLQSDPPFIPDWFEPETLEMQPEKILAVDAKDLSSCAPEIPADAIFDFGFIPEPDGYSRQYFRLSFDLNHRGIERLFSRALVQDAWRVWQDQTGQTGPLPSDRYVRLDIDEEPGCICLLAGGDIRQVHTAGHRFARLFHEGLLEAGADPCVVVRYLEFDLPIARQR